LARDVFQHRSLKLWKNDQPNPISLRSLAFQRHVVTNKKIAIIGFMGSGKTTVAHELALKLNCLAVDLDAVVTRSEGRSPKEIIEKDGENTFRKIEAQALKEILVEERARIVAVGGGAWTIAENRKLLADHGASTVWLDAPFELCWKRIEADREARPLARSRTIAKALYSARRPVYKLAEVRIPVYESESIEEIAQKVAHTVWEQNASG
jgi:shikimate kinase